MDSRPANCRRSRHLGPLNAKFDEINFGVAGALDGYQRFHFSLYLGGRGIGWRGFFDRSAVEHRRQLEGKDSW